MGRLFGFDPATNTVERFHWDPTAESYTIEDTQEVSAILDQNNALRNSDAKHDRKSPMRRAAAIPLNIYFDLVARGIQPGTAAFDKWLDDPDNAMWRTDNAKVYSKTKHYRG
jgi:hypothetical protein